MLNGIRLDNFNNGLPKGLDNDLRTVLSNVDSTIRKYENYLSLQFNLLFGQEQEVVAKNESNEQRYAIKPIKYRNILERLNIVIRRSDTDIYYTYYVYDLDSIHTVDDLVLQDKHMNNILKYYVETIGQLNSTCKVKRNFIFEFNFLIYNEGELIDFWKYLSEFTLSEQDSNNSAANIINAYVTHCIVCVKKTIAKIFTSQVTQYYILFVNPDKNINNTNDRSDKLIQHYKYIIQNVSTYQLRTLQYSTGLIGPNTETTNFNASDTFLFNIQDIASNFEIYSFTCNYINNDYNKKIFLTNIKGNELTSSNLLQQSLELYKQDVYTFYNKLFSYNIYNSDEERYLYQDDSGLLQWDINVSFQSSLDILYTTSSYILYQDTYNELERYNTVTSDNPLGDGGFNQLSLYDDDDTDLAYIVYGTDITIAPHYARALYLNNTKQDILTPISLNLNDYQGVCVIIEDNTLDKSDLTDLYNKIRITLQYYQDTIRHLIKLLPKSYNKEVDDTNFFKLLRVAAMELAESKYNLLEVSNGVYLNDLNVYNNTYEQGDYLRHVSGDLVYNNFGALIDLPKKDKWTYTQYRNIVTAIINALLAGPTKANIEEAIAKFTGYKNYIYELYKEKDNILFQDLATVNLTYKFALMLVKDLNKFDDSQELYKDLLYLLHIIKPAQALFIIYIIFEQGEQVDTVENLSDILTNDDIPQVYANLNQRELFGYKLKDTFQTHINKGNDEDYNRSKLEGSDLNYKKLAMPERWLKDEFNARAIINLSDTYNPFDKCYFKTGAEFAEENNDGKLSNTHYILFGTGLSSADHFQATLTIPNIVYTNTQLEDITQMKTSGVTMEINDVITIQSNDTVSINNSLQFTTNFKHVEWGCIDGRIDNNGLYTPLHRGQDTIIVKSIIDEQKIEKNITVV